MSIGHTYKSYPRPNLIFPGVKRENEKGRERKRERKKSEKGAYKEKVIEGGEFGHFPGTLE